MFCPEISSGGSVCSGTEQDDFPSRDTPKRQQVRQMVGGKKRDRWVSAIIYPLNDPGRALSLAHTFLMPPSGDPPNTKTAQDWPRLLNFFPRGLWLARADPGHIPPPSGVKRHQPTHSHFSTWGVGSHQCRACASAQVLQCKKTLSVEVAVQATFYANFHSCVIQNKNSFAAIDKTLLRGGRGAKQGSFWLRSAKRKSVGWRCIRSPDAPSPGHRSAGTRAGRRWGRGGPAAGR